MCRTGVLKCAVKSAAKTATKLTKLNKANSLTLASKGRYRSEQEKLKEAKKLQSFCF